MLLNTIFTCTAQDPTQTHPNLFGQEQRALALGRTRGEFAASSIQQRLQSNEENPCTSATPSVTHCIINGFALATAPPERQPALGYTSPISSSADSGDPGGSRERPRQGRQAEHGPFQKGSARPASPTPRLPAPSPARSPSPAPRPRTPPIAPPLPHAATAHGRPTRHLNFPRPRPAIGQFEPKQPPDWSV